MREEKKSGCGCGTLVFTAIVCLFILVGLGIVANKYVMIVPREKPTPTPARQVVEKAPAPPPVQQPVVVMEPTPAPTVDLQELKSRMQDWPDEVTLAGKAVFPGDVVAPEGTNVKLISAGPEVEVQYQDEEAKLSADQTDLVARVLAHRAQVAREQAIDRNLAALAAARANHQADARAFELERVHGKQPSREDAYYAAKTYLKQSAKDPDSVEIINASATFPSEFGGRKCWAIKVSFRSRDEMGFAREENGTVYLEGDKATGYERAQ